jgi:hypothetical protein
VQSLTSAGTIIDDDDTVIFDTIINDQSANIAYNPATGVFTFTAAGTYLVTWWIATDGTEGSPTVTFTVFSGMTAISGSSPLVTGQVQGTALLTVPVAPAAMSLVNTTGSSVALATTPRQADLTIVELA